MQATKYFKLKMDAEDDYKVRIGAGMYRIVKLSANSSDVKVVWVWYDSDNGVELQQLPMRDLPHHLFCLVRGHVL